MLKKKKHLWLSKSFLIKKPKYLIKKKRKEKKICPPGSPGAPTDWMVEVSEL